MSSRNCHGPVAAALEFLRKRNHYYQFDNQERVVEVAIYDAENADEIAVHLANLCDLRDLKIRRSKLTNAGLQSLRNHPTLQKLLIDGPHLTADGVSALPSITTLQYLALSEAAGMDRHGFEQLARCMSLKHLHVYHTNCSDADVMPLGALVNLEQLVLSQNDNLTGAYCEQFSRLSRLKDLSAGDQVTDDALKSMSRLSSLEELYVGGPFTDLGLRRLQSLRNLRTLYVTSQQITDEGLLVLLDLPELSHVGVKMPKLSDAGAAIIARCRNLELLTCSNSRLSRKGRRLLREALPHCDLHFMDDEPGTF